MLFLFDIRTLSTFVFCSTDLVVQSGPGSWPSHVYVQSAKYPMANSAAQVYNSWHTWNHFFKNIFHIFKVIFVFVVPFLDSLDVALFCRVHCSWMDKVEVYIHVTYNMQEEEACLLQLWHLGHYITLIFFIFIFYRGTCIACIYEHLLSCLQFASWLCISTNTCYLTWNLGHHEPDIYNLKPCILIFIIHSPCSSCYIDTNWSFSF